MLTCILATYDSLYKVIVRSSRVMKILVKGKVETVFLDRVQAAHLDNEPAKGTEKQRKTQTNAKNSKNTATVRREPALKQNSEKKRAEPKAKNTDTVCSTSTWYEFGYSFTA